ncbi:MAG: glycosyltransferase family 4 protein [Dehalococcoidia bacterium]|nr:glycosyltransferase family 4 protein [Dehalococcoidia bacterium]
MMPECINPENTEFVILSFEGPDRYSLAGGLGVRVVNLSQTLSRLGFNTRLFFIGDPGLRGEEVKDRLILHRWCQWISEYYPLGVYQGEEGKLNDFNSSAPNFIIERVVKPAVARGKFVVVLGEEWHTAEAMCRLSDELRRNGLRDNAVMFWNANNTFGFERINWGRLASSATITTVSRYMRHIMRGMDVNPLVIPNGIPNALLDNVDVRASARLRKSIKADSVLTKVARWDPDKQWVAAVEATARLKARGTKPVLLARGGMEAHGGEVLYKARSLGLTVKEVSAAGNSMEDYFQAFRNVEEADVLDIRFHCPQEFLRIVFHASDAVLANSRHEPFGLVGLETMAAGGIAFTGNTGEDYAVPFLNSVVLETSDPKEIETNVIHLEQHPDESKRMRKAARETAGQFTWERVAEHLIRKLEYQARAQGIMAQPQWSCVQEPQPLRFGKARHEMPPVAGADFGRKHGARAVALL